MTPDHGHHQWIQMMQECPRGFVITIAHSPHASWDIQPSLHWGRLRHRTTAAAGNDRRQGHWVTPNQFDHTVPAKERLEGKSLFK